MASHSFRVRVGNLIFIVRESRNQRWRNMQIARRMYDIVLDTTRNNGDVMTLQEFYENDGLVTLFSRILKRVKTHHLSKKRSRRSLVQLALLASGLEYPVITDVAPLFGRTSSVVLELLERVAMLLNSRQNVSIDNTFHLHVTIVDGPNPNPRHIWIAGKISRLPAHFDVSKALGKKFRNCLIMPDLSGTRYHSACLLAALAADDARRNNIAGFWKSVQASRHNQGRYGKWTKKATQALLSVMDSFVDRLQLDLADFAPANLGDSLHRLANRAKINLSVFSMRGGCLPIFKHPPGAPDPALPTVSVVAIPQCQQVDSSSTERRSQAEWDSDDAEGETLEAWSEREEEEEEEDPAGHEDSDGEPSRKKSKSQWNIPANDKVPDQLWHAALVLNPSCLLPTTKSKSSRCLHCHRSFSKKYMYAHKCVLPQCSTCRRVIHQKGHFQDAFTARLKCCRPANCQNTTQCKYCRRPVYSPQCLRSHRLVCGKTKKFCTKCGKTYDAKNERRHRCGERFCRICRKHVMEHWTGPDKRDHACVMTRPEPSKFAQPLAFFDMETVQDSQGNHQANAVGLSFETRKNPGKFSEIYFYDLDMGHDENEKIASEIYEEQYWPAAEFKPCHRSEKKVKKSENEALPISADNSALVRFVDFFFVPRFAHYTLIGHAAARFDSILLLQELLRRNLAVEPLFDGNKALQLRIPSLKIRVIDSYRYIKLPLSKFSQRFPTLQAQEFHKGTFPFKFNSFENYDYRGPLPERSFYIDQFSSDKAVSAYEEEKERWGAREDWIFKEQLHKYLAQDVRVLRGGCLAFSRELYDFQSDLHRDKGCLTKTVFHPFSNPFFTKSSFVHALWRYFAMPPNAINLATNQRNSIKTSRGEMEWLSYLIFRNGSSLQDLRSAYHHAKGQARIGPYSADGLCKNTVYEFNGCLAHYHAAETKDCPKSACFSPCDNNPFGTSMQQAGAAWKKKKDFLTSRGYRVVTMWECQWDKEKETNDNVKDFLNTDFYGSLERPKERLRLRTGLRGGRTESFRLRFDQTQFACQNRNLYYVDKNSLYPSMAVFKSFPIGPLDVFIGERLKQTVKFDPGKGFLDIATGEKLEGIVQATVLPPDALFLPILPARVGDKLKFGLCRTCLETMQESPCTHQDRERYITGEWTTPEIVFAVECG